VIGLVSLSAGNGVMVRFLGKRRCGEIVDGFGMGIISLHRLCDLVVT
jgi:hypothetical protein